MEEQVKAEEPEQATDETTIEKETDQPESDFRTELDKVTQQFKKEISGLNRRNSELEKFIEEQKKASMSEIEKREYEIQQKEQALTEAETNMKRSANREKAVKFATENGLDIDLLDTMSFDNWEVVESTLHKQKAVVDRVKQKTIEEFKKSSGYSPAAGGGNANTATLSKESLKDMTAKEISEALRDGRIKGFGKL